MKSLFSFSAIALGAIAIAMFIIVIVFITAICGTGMILKDEKDVLFKHEKKEKSCF